MRRTAFLITAALCAAVLQADSPKFDWPLKDGFPEIRGITSTFGESRGDHFHNGVDIASTNEAVRPMAPGKILFVRALEDDPFAPLIGPGTLVMIDHGKGWWSGYYHLAKPGKIRSGEVTTDSVIGYSGNTGHSVGAHLHFFVSKDYGRTMVNPLIVLPGTVDKNPPDIGALTIVTQESKTLLPPGKLSRVRLSQAFPVYAEVRDPGLERNTNRGVYELRWKLNDAPEERRTFQKLTVRDGEWQLDGQGFDSVFGNGQYFLGRLSFQNGRNTVKITAIDQAGNESSQDFEIDVQRMY